MWTRTQRMLGNSSEPDRLELGDLHADAPVALLELDARLLDDLVHGALGRGGVAGADRVQHPPVHGEAHRHRDQRAPLQAEADLEHGRDDGPQPIDERVARGREHGAMEGEVGAVVGERVVDRRRHVRQRRSQRLQLVGAAPGGGETGGGGLDHPAQLDQMLHQLGRRTGRRLPRQHVRVEQVPGLLGADPHAQLLPALDQPLGGQHLDRLAHRRARDAQLLHQLGLARQHGARRQLAAEDAAADLLDQPPMHAAGRVDPAGVAGRERRAGHAQCIHQPPSTPRFWPVMKCALSEIRKRIALAMSSGLPRYFSA